MPKGFEQNSYGPKKSAPEIPYNEEDNARRKNSTGSVEPFVPVEEIIDPASENWEDEKIAAIDKKRTKKPPQPKIITERVVLNSQDMSVKPMSEGEKKMVNNDKGEDNAIIHSTRTDGYEKVA